MKFLPPCSMTRTSVYQFLLFVTPAYVAIPLEIGGIGCDYATGNVVLFEAKMGVRRNSRSKQMY